MYNRFLATNAQDALANTKLAQEEKKRAMIREQKERELKQFETQLFYKKQEVLRLKSLSDRLRRESTMRQSTQIKETREVQNFERDIKDTEMRVKKLEEDVTHALTEIAEKISKEKSIVIEHQKNIDTLEKQKRDIDSKKSMSKRALAESFSRLLFFKKKEENEAQIAKRLYETNQSQLHQIEQSLKTFTQETTVLENKIRALRTVVR